MVWHRSRRKDNRFTLYIKQKIVKPLPIIDKSGVKDPGFTSEQRKNDTGSMPLSHITNAGMVK